MTPHDASAQQAPGVAGPLHALEIRISIGANHREYALQTLREILATFEDGNISNSCSGCWDGAYSVTSAIREISPDDYRKELEEWSEQGATLMPSPGVSLIRTERMRQVSDEGMTAEHDDSQDGFELTRAASCYAEATRMIGLGSTVKIAAQINYAGTGWPWDWEYWKVSPDVVRNLVKAGALIAAEIDRVLRAREQSATLAMQAKAEG
jgi:hypothetical protein